jgi:hypothetical protein
LLLNAFLKLGKLVLNAKEVVLKFLEDGVCLLSDYSIDWGLDVGYCLWEEGFKALIFSPVNDLSLNLDDRFKNFLDSLLRLRLIGGLNVAGSESIRARGMDHFDRVYAECFRHVSRHMFLLDKALIV